MSHARMCSPRDCNLRGNLIAKFASCPGRHFPLVEQTNGAFAKIQVIG